MRYASSMNYHQMLVVSVFLHLLVITIIMFLPKQKIQKKIIVPAFNVDVVEIPAQRKAAPRGMPKVEEAKPRLETPQPSEETKPVPKAEKAPAPKPMPKAPPPAPLKKLKKPEVSKIVEELERLDDSKKSLARDLDQLAKLKPPETRSLGDLKKRKTDPQKTLKKEELEEESEFETLTKKPVELKKESREKTAAELIKEFQRATELEALKAQTTKLDEVAKKIDLAMTVGQPFSSALHKKEEVPGAGKVASTDRKDPLALYIGLVKERVYSNWKNPLGAESREVYVSFFLFSQGNIGKPFVEKSSGSEPLDSLAVRAILDSDPFPKFPPDLKEPSLHMTIRFKYIPQN